MTKNKITEGNSFALNIRQAVWRTLGGVIQPLLASDLVDVHLYVGSGTSKSTATEYNVTADGDTISAVMPATLKRGVYRTWMTALYQGREVASACECAFEIVAFDEHGIYAPERIDGQPCVYLQGASMTDPEIEQYKARLLELQQQKEQEVQALEAERQKLSDVIASLESGFATDEQMQVAIAALKAVLDSEAENAKKTDIGNLATHSDAEEIKQTISEQTSAQTEAIQNQLRGVAQESEIGAIENISKQSFNLLNKILNGLFFTSKNIDGYTLEETTQEKLSILDLILRRNKIVSIDDDDLVVFNTKNPSDSSGFQIKDFLSPNFFYLKAKNATDLSTLWFRLLPIQEVYLDNLVYAHDTMFRYCNFLKTLYTPNINLSRWGYGLGICEGCANVIDWTLGKNHETLQNNIIPIAKWNPTEALKEDSTSLVDFGESFASNREKLLYNVRNHFAANLPVVDSGTITFSADMYSAITADEQTAESFTSKGWTITT